MKDGYIKIYRKCLEHELFLELPYDRWHAFESLLIMARWKPTDIVLKGNVVHLERGQLIIGVDKLATQWGWSKNKVYRYLKLLKQLEIISYNGTPNGTLITIENYTFYQGQQIADGTPNESADGTPNESADGTHIKKVKKEKKEKNILSAHELFEKLWKLYPNKKGKGQVSDTKKNNLLKVGEEEMVRAIERYKKELDTECDWRKPQNGSTFFNSGYVDYLDANYKEGNGIEKIRNNKSTELSAEDYYTTGEGIKLG